LTDEKVVYFLMDIRFYGAYCKNKVAGTGGLVKRIAPQFSSQVVFHQE
jgi:hypothetical protein